MLIVVLKFKQGTVSCQATPALDIAYTGYDMIRGGRTILATVLFFVGFAILLMFVSHWFLLPAMDVARQASRAEKQRLVAYASLLLAILLLVLFIGVLMVSRVRRFFEPRTPVPRQKTEYIDAWAEAGKRIRNDSDNEPE